MQDVVARVALRRLRRGERRAAACEREQAQEGEREETVHSSAQETIQASREIVRRAREGNARYSSSAVFLETGWRATPERAVRASPYSRRAALRAGDARFKIPTRSRKEQYF